MHAKLTQNETARQSTEPNASIDPSNDTMTNLRGADQNMERVMTSYNYCIVPTN